MNKKIVEHNQGSINDSNFMHVLYNIDYHISYAYISNSGYKKETVKSRNT